MASSPRPRAVCASREELPRFLEPMLATTGTPPAGDEWAAEVKWDGMRAQVRFDGRTVCVRSRPGRNCSDEFPELDHLASALAGRRVVLDGELVTFGLDGKPDFAALRRRLIARSRERAAVAAARTPATLVVFDVLHLDGFALRELPYGERRETLAALALEGPFWRTPPHFTGAAESLRAATAAQCLEGIVAKRLDSSWVSRRRSPCWRKVKNRRRETMVVTGWRSRRDEPDEFLLARRDREGRLVPSGSASFGLSAARRAGLVEALAAEELPKRRSGVRWSAARIEVVVESHGAFDGQVRDAVLRDVVSPLPSAG